MNSIAEENAGEKGSLLYVYLVCIVAAVGGFLFGYDTAVISGAIVFLQKHFALNSIQLGIAVSSVIVGCILGAISAGFLSDWLGRKRILIAAALLFLISAILTAIPRNLIEFLVARFIGGLAIGFASPVSPTYIAEIAPAKIRGALVTLTQLAITFGILAAYVVDWLIAGLGPESWKIAYSWRWMFASEAAPAALFVIALLFIPESPRWLAKEGLLERAKAILARVGGRRHAQKELEEIKEAITMEEASIVQLFRPGFRIALIIGILLAVFSQITGINVIIYYTPMILLDLGFESASTALLGMVVVGIINFITTIVAVCIIDKVGRKPLLLIAPAGMCICLILVGVKFYFGVFSPLFILIAILCYCSFFAIGVGTGSWLVISEIFPTRVRGRAVSICTFSLWVSNFVAVLVFPSLLELSRAGTFWLFAILSFVMVAFVWRMIPETKQKTLEEIEKFWRRG